uniref:CCHC-type domain-containing protein n=1 Tax=Tanacetum cinerariifolium TaxID=118510 RepID=A0A6L2K6P8_TANCI|nr:hypothetical protein [Tanacetum cinerariifolium]
MLIKYEKGLPKKDTTPQVMAIQGGRIQKANKKLLNAKGKGKGKEVGHWKRKCLVELAEFIKKKKQLGTASLRGEKKLKQGALYLFVINDVHAQVKAIESYDLETATRILNLVPTKKVEKTPYELWIPKGNDGLLFLLPPENKIIVARFKIDNSKRGNISMQERLDLNKTQGALTPEEVKQMQNIPYASAVVSIMYAVRCTRPDIAFAQNITSNFQHNSGKPHWTAIKTIFKYLRNIKDMILVYGGNHKAELRVNCCCNAGFDTNRDDIKSQIGYVSVLNRGAIDWKSFKQSTTAIVRKNHATGARVVNTDGNAGANQPRVIRCYNCNSEGHIAKQCITKKRVKDSDWFKDKMLLSQAKEARVVLNDEQQDFLANSLEENDKCEDLQLQATTNFKADHVDAYDSDCDDEVATNTIFMENLSSVGSINDDIVKRRYDSDILSEVPHYDTYHESDMLNSNVQEMEYIENIVFNNESYDELTSNINVISYAEYMVTISNNADNYVPPPVENNDMILSVIEQMKSQVEKCNMETLILAEDSRLKMIEKQTQVKAKSTDYAKLNKLYEDFVPQKQLSAEQLYWSSTTSRSKRVLKLTKVFPKKLPSTSQVLKKSSKCMRSSQDKIIYSLNKTLDLFQEPPKNCAKCGNSVNGHYCHGCALLRKKFKEDLFTYCIENGILQDFQDASEPSNDNTNVVNALQEPFVVKQNLSKNSSQSPPQINHHCCYECGDSLEDICCH